MLFLFVSLSVYDILHSATFLSHNTNYNLGIFFFFFLLFFSSHLDLPLSLQIYFLVLFFPQILTAMVATIIHTLFCCVKYVSFGRDLHISNLYPCIINIIKYNHHNPLPQLTFSLFLKLPCHNCIAMSGTCSVVFTFSWCDCTVVAALTNESCNYAVVVLTNESWLCTVVAALTNQSCDYVQL